MSSIRDQMILKECKQLQNELTTLETEAHALSRSYQDIKNQEAALQQALRNKQRELHAVEAKCEIHGQKTESKRAQLEQLQSKVEGAAGQGWDWSEFLPSPASVLEALS